MDLAKVREFGNIELLARQLVEGFITGLHKSPYHGFSVEFAEHKVYNPGESTRHIDWKVYAKTDRLYTKRYEEETNLRCQLVLDVSRSMYYPEAQKGKITFSIMAAAALAYLLQRQRDAVGLFTFADSILQQTPVKSTAAHLHKLLLLLQQQLDSTVQAQKTNVAEVLHLIAEKISRRSLVVIFSDMFETGQENEALFAALQHLKHNKHEVLLFHVVHHSTELDFAFEDRPHLFVDLESGQKIALQPSEIKKRYQEASKEWFEHLKQRCTQLQIDLVEANIEDPFEKILQAYLIKRGKMR